MDAMECHRYHLELADRRITSMKLEDKQGKATEVRTFRKPVTQKDLPKLYVVRNRSRVIYVGHTRQPIRNRLRYGLQATGKGGYYGYSWKELREVHLLIWCFPWEPTERVESIEAEVVYLVRNDTGQWPGYQTEIHFHSVREEEKKVAELIYQEALK